jgi:sulfur-carrier protein
MRETPAKRVNHMAKILYFAALVEKLGTSSEEVTLPAEVTDVWTLLTWLRTRGDVWEHALAEPAVQVTVNRQLAAPETRIDDTVEIAIVSARLR